MHAQYFRKLRALGGVPMPEQTSDRVLVFGASGYIGRHLTPALAREGYRVRAAARRLQALEAENWQGVECIAADVFEPQSLRTALAGIETAYYLVHSMAAGEDFPDLDRQAAERFAAAAAEAGVRRIVYLGGLTPPDPDTPHLASRLETGDILRRGAVPVIELRAGIIVGPGSAAFEVMRDLVAHLPIMVTPRWVYSKSPPVALEDLIADLIALPSLDAALGQIFETRGPELMTYEDMMHVLTAKLGRRGRIIIPVPVLTPKLSSYWLGFISAVPVNVARALITGLKYDLDADDAPLRALIPRKTIGFNESVDRVFALEQQIVAVDRWRVGAFALRGSRHDVSFYCKTMTRRASGAANTEDIWGTLSAIGTTGKAYFFCNALWSLRAWLDRRFGGRQAPKRGSGEPLVKATRFDFWEVIAVAPERRLTLLSHLVAPGAGGLEFEIDEQEDGSGALSATIYWHPAGFLGILYWYALWPAHAWMLRGMVRAIIREARTKRQTTQSEDAIA